MGHKQCRFDTLDERPQRNAATRSSCRGCWEKNAHPAAGGGGSQARDVSGQTISPTAASTTQLRRVHKCFYNSRTRRPEIVSSVEAAVPEQELLEGHGGPLVLLEPREEALYIGRAELEVQFAQQVEKLVCHKETFVVGVLLAICDG
jgi:hypothetical protein